MTWSVSMFSPVGMYGFCAAPDGDEVFFHAQDFHRLMPGGPPPVLGECVEIEGLDQEVGNRPRARKVLRVETPSLQEGLVRSFDSSKGWGFIDYSDGQAFLHASELMSGWLPVIGTSVEFYVGRKLGRPRACWVRPVDVVGTVTFQGGNSHG